MAVVATVTPIPSLSVPGLRYVADVNWVNIDDTDPTITHNLGLVNVKVDAVVTAAGTVAASASVNYGAATLNSFTMTKNTTAANTTMKQRVTVSRPHSIDGAG